MKASFLEVISIPERPPEQTSVILGSQWRHLWGARVWRRRSAGSRSAARRAPSCINTPAAEKLYDSALAALKEGSKTLIWCSTFTRRRHAVALRLRRAARHRTREPRRGARRIRTPSQRRQESLLPPVGPRPSCRGCSRSRCRSAAPSCRPAPDGPQPRGAPLHDRPPHQGWSTSPATPPPSPATPPSWAPASALKSVSPVDLFPQTSHECVGLSIGLKT